MTGFGRGEAAGNGYQVSVDISSVNRKQLDVRFSPPKEALFLESVVRNTVPKFLARGNVNVQLKLNLTDGFSSVRFNDQVIKGYVDHIREMQDAMDIDTPVSLTEVFMLPGAVEPGDPEISVDDLTEVAEKAIISALENLVEARSVEGAHLKEDLTARKDVLIQSLKELTAKTAGTGEQFREKIMSRIKEAGLDLELDNDRLHQEVVFYADRADVTEELVRLEAHVKQFAQLLNKTAPVGRELDFLMQEINREVNTCASKSSDREIARLVVALKAELERCREQIQNVE
jgi:uncharacterized protein (TIGR00255 family)